MSYSIKWDDKLVCIDYFGDIDNTQIERAHFTLNGDERFYDCRSLILDISKCTMDRVSVDDLIRVIGTDLGASESNQSLKVAMIAIAPQNIEKATRYINKCRAFGYPWEFQLFSSMDKALAWLSS